MPLTVEDIEVRHYEKEDDLNGDKYLCSICQQEIDHTRMYDPINHTLDICLKNIMERLNKAETELCL